MNKQTIRLNNKIRRYLRNKRHEVEEKHSIPCTECDGRMTAWKVERPADPCEICKGTGKIEQPSTFRTVGRTPPVGYEVGMTGGAR